MISIVATVHNRRMQLINTLNSIAFYYYDHDPIEVILVDDTDVEEESIDDLPFNYPFPVHLIKVTNKDWISSGVSYNIGFKAISGGTVIIQNGECMHMGNILKYVKENSRSGLYLTFGAFSMKRSLGIVDYAKDRDSLIMSVGTSPVTYPRGRHGWFNHTHFRPCKFHFCSAISRSDLEKISGFDERYADGYAHEDAEILVRIENAGIESVIIDDPFVIHQLHDSPGMAASHPSWMINKERYEVTLTENLIKPPNNKIYVR